MKLSIWVLMTLGIVLRTALYVAERLSHSRPPLLSVFPGWQKMASFSPLSNCHLCPKCRGCYPRKNGHPCPLDVSGRLSPDLRNWLYYVGPGACAAVVWFPQCAGLCNHYCIRCHRLHGLVWVFCPLSVNDARFELDWNVEFPKIRGPGNVGNGGGSLFVVVLLSVQTIVVLPFVLEWCIGTNRAFVNFAFSGICQIGPEEVFWMRGETSFKELLPVLSPTSKH